MAQINTVLGPIDASKLGFTLGHEHVFVASAGVRYVYPEFVDKKAIVKKAVRELRQAVEEGVNTIVDVSVLDLGRDVRVEREVSRRTGINIIAATGNWLDVPRVFAAADPNRLADLYVREIVDGIEGTDVRAGVIKVASDGDSVSAASENIIRGAARACKRTGVPITTHTGAAARLGLRQIEIIEQEGADLDKVVIGHSNDSTDLDYLTAILRKGAWLGLDRYPGGGRPGIPGWEERTRVVKQLLDMGWADKIMLSHDWVSSMLNARPDMQAQREKNNPDGYLFITRKVLPYLKQLGGTDQQIKQLMVDNPRRFFGVS